MPTSSQALAYLKHVTDSCVGGQALSADSTSACHLPNVFPQRYEEDTHSTSHVGLRVLGEVLQQRPHGRPYRSELVLPPINNPTTQPLTLVASDSRKATEITCNNKHCRQRRKERSRDSESNTFEHCKNVGISQISDSQFSQNLEATRGLPKRTRINSDLPHKTGHGEQDFLAGAIPTSACSQQSMVSNTSDVWTQGDASLSQDVNDPNCKKPLMTCVLNLNLWDQSCETHFDNSSCIGILSYNHQMGRHEWSLVPQNSPIPFRAVRGSYIKSRNPVESSTLSALPDQSGNFSDGAQLKKDSDEDMLAQTGVSELFAQQCDNLEEEEMKNRKELSEHEGIERWQIHDPDVIHAFPGQFQFAHALSKQDYHQPKASNTSESSRLIQTWSERLKPSGIIYNESYFFEEDAEDIIPHFLETLISAPKGGEEVSVHYLPNIAESDYGLHVTSAPILKCRSFKVTSRPALYQRKRDKVQPTAHHRRLNKVSVKPPEPSEPASGKSLSPERNSRAAEHTDTLCTLQEPGVGDVDAAAQMETHIQMSTPMEARVLRMRTELPPSQPNRLCFRTTLSGCSHNEVISGIESQKNIKVTWLQYEPVSLHYTDVAKPDYRHLCMWLFEVSSESDLPRLLLEGFTLRGQHMNVLHLDDVYLEEFRTFNMCNDVLMEQRSKHLIKNKNKRLLRSSPTVL
ncbi:unnamed protein product [Candidula unifasciata]|uniref:Uncharacterized protein n=1 Tax=Candidula unifasciata TaxID=100452 RepID=A0A8S3YX85_9EUPU|nr:unnamed protein product [Candidula unifasciata]